MKKMIIAVAAIMMAAANIIAQEKVETVNNVTPISYDFNINMRSLSRYLDLTQEQIEVMEYASENFGYSIKRLERTKEEKRGARMQKALNINLAYAHKFLDDKQYRKYLALMNNSLKNKGLDTLLKEESLASK
ncbi:MAG: hypothetical protein IKX59_07180 [Bacteroidales bacterium]|nr:hypothetical protein [Bacteroidales bacterium]